MAPQPINNDQLALLLQILGAQGASTSPMFDASALARVSPSSISSVLNPEVMVASGLLDPDVLGAGITGAENQLAQEFLAETSRSVPVPLETTPMWFRDITSEYGVQAVSDPTTGRVVFAPTAGNDLSDYVATQFNAISSGDITASQAKTALADLVSSDERYKPFASELTNIQNSLDAFEKKSEASKNASLKYEYDVSQAAGSGVAPTRQQAMAEYYKQIGLPQLALLGDPTATYQIPAETFLRGQKVKDLEAELAKQQSAMKRGESRYGQGAEYATKQAEVYTQKAIADEARKRAEAKVAEIEQPIKPWQRQYAVQFNREKDEAYKRFYDAAVRELSQKPVSGVSISNLSPDYGLAKAKAYTAEKALTAEQERAAKVAELVSQGLAARGKTPFNAQLEQLLGYAITSKTKK